jgi:hypothetical protein
LSELLSQIFEGEGSLVEVKIFNSTLGKLLKSCGGSADYARLQGITINQVSKTVSTVKKAPAKEPTVNAKTAKSNGGTSRPRSAKEDKKNIAKLRVTSKKYIIIIIINNIIFL